MIPIRLIWTIQLRPRQKLALAATLCLSVVMVVFGLIRAKGLKLSANDLIDITWGAYWALLATEVGIILVSLTAFRSLFVAHAAKRPAGAGHRAWYSSGRRLLRPKQWARIGRNSSSGKGSSGPEHGGSGRDAPPLAEIPGATMTGVRTYIGGVGRTNASEESDWDGWAGSGLPPKEVESVV